MSVNQSRFRHSEQHFTATDLVRDVVIGMSDGLTVPFALAAGLSGAVASTGIIVTAGVAEIAAGSIAMGLGGYLAGKTEVEHYRNERQRELEEVLDHPDEEADEVAAIFASYGLEPAQIEPVVAAIRANPDRWVDFMMRFELGLEEPDPGQARKSALTIAVSYVVGGLIPLTPYMVLPDIHEALGTSVGVTLAALAIFGAVKGRFMGTALWRGGLETMLTGGLAAAAAFFIARLIG